MIRRLLDPKFSEGEYASNVSKTAPAPRTCSKRALIRASSAWSQSKTPAALMAFCDFSDRFRERRRAVLGIADGQLVRGLHSLLGASRDRARGPSSGSSV